MACRASRGTIISMSLGLLIFVISHCNCSTLTRLKALDELKEDSMHTQSQAESQSQQHHGRLLIGQNTEQDAKLNGTNSTSGLLDVESDYQADMGWWQNKQPGGQDHGPLPDTAAVQHVLTLDPRVECTGDSMKLLVQDAASTPASLLFVDRGHLSPLSLSKLPPSCGYTIRSTRRDLILSAPYDGCFVILEEDSYVLPLRWWGLPVRMSCPLMRHMSPSPPMVTCHADGMVVKTDWTNSASRMKVNVNGQWEPLLKAAQRCVFGIVEHPEGLVLSVHYSPCLEKKGGLYSLELAAEGKTKVSCPPLLPGYPQSQTEMPRKWLYSSSHSTSARLPVQTVHQVPGFPQIPNKPGQGPKEHGHPEFPYPPFQSFVPSSHARPDSLPTSQHMNPTATPQITQIAGKPQLPAQPPVTKPPGNYEKPIVQNTFNLPPGFSQKPVQPSGGQSEGQDLAQLHQLFCTQISQDRNLKQLCLEKLQENPGLLHSLLSENQQGDLYAPFYLFHPQQPASKPTGVFQPGATRGNTYQSFYPLYTKPGQTSKPGGAPQQSKPGAPQSPMYQPFYPIFTQPKPATKPGGGPQQSKPGTPLSPIYQPFYPIFTQPKPVTKPVGTSRPSQPGTPPGQVQQKPGIQLQSKPTDQQQPESPRGQMYKPFYPYIYSKPKPAVKPTGVSQSSQPVTTLRQVQQPPHTQSKPGDPLAPKLFGPHPEVSLDQWHQQMCLYTRLLTPNQQGSKPTADHKPSTENMQGLFYGPCQPYRTPGPGTNYGSSMENSRQSSQMSTIKPPHGKMSYPSNLPYYLQHPHYLTLPSTSMQQVSAQGGNPKQSDSSQTGNGGISPHTPPFYCPQFCHSGFNCCIQIAFHQHLHIFPDGFEGKDTSPFYSGLPLSAVAYTNPVNGLELSSFPQLADLTIHAEGAGIPAQSLSQLYSTAEKRQPHGQPPDGNPAVLPGSSPGNPTNPQVLVYPYFPTDSLYPLHLPQNMDLQQRNSAVFSDPSKLWVSGEKPLVHYGPYNIQVPKQSNQLGGNNPSKPNFMSVKQFSPHSAEQQNEPRNEQQSFNEFSGYRHELDQFFPYYMPQDAPVPTQNDSVSPNNSQAQPFVKHFENSTTPEHSLDFLSAQQSFVLLQHGPPGREQTHFSDSPVPFRDLVHSANSAKHHTYPLKFELLQENGQQLKWPVEGTSSPVPGDVTYMHRLDESDFPLFSRTLDKPQMRLPPEKSPSAPHSKPEAPESFENPWKSLVPTSSSQKFPPHVPGKVFPQWSSMADQPDNGKK